MLELVLVSIANVYTLCDSISVHTYIQLWNTTPSHNKFCISLLYLRSGSSGQFTSELEHLKIQLQTNDLVISDGEGEPRENVPQEKKVIYLTHRDFIF